MKTAVLAICLAAACWGQKLVQRGYVETRGLAFPDPVPGDSSSGAGEVVARWDVTYRLSDAWKVSGAVDARVDTHRQNEREFRVDWMDRSARRPNLSLRRFSTSYHKGRLTLEFGKQFIRWGKADILNPTDRFAPKDFLEVINTDYLGVLAARAVYEAGSHTFDLVYTPRMTPSRSPLPNQRWVVMPETVPGLAVVDNGTRYPGGGQAGARWNYLGPGFELSTSFFEGYNHLPSIELGLVPQRPFAAGITRFFPRLRFYGGDAAVPLKWFTVKGEAGYFTSSNRSTDEFLLYVLQLERQQGEWSFVGGYAGEYVTEARNPLFFAPDRGIARTFLGRVGYTIDTNRGVAIETAIRQNGDGAYLKGEYSQAFGQHWRTTAGFVLLRGNRSDFLGQYKSNSHVLATMRYSF
ncbi:MAG: hypothetical protein JNK48_17125 [Bryobacterales bacterium]|nr:hypothetical protein [Bryobacterales bacterium]